MSSESKEKESAEAVVALAAEPAPPKLLELLKQELMKPGQTGSSAVLTAIVTYVLSEVQKMEEEATSEITADSMMLLRMKLLVSVMPEGMNQSAIEKLNEWKSEVLAEQEGSSEEESDEEESDEEERETRQSLSPVRGAIGVSPAGSSRSSTPPPRRLLESGNSAVRGNRDRDRSRSPRPGAGD